jgi:opacity protein-like surface antigen
VVGEEAFNDVEGVIDVGLKYRFVDLKIARLGVGLNAGYYNFKYVYNGDNGFYDFDDIDIDFNDFDIKEKDYFIQPKIFADFNIPAVPKLVPSVGIGYSTVIVDISSNFQGESTESSETYGGINFNIGLSYDILANFFVQAQYDLIPLKFENESIGYEENVNVGTVKIGVGIRF